MAPLRHTTRNCRSLLNSLIAAISSFFRSRTSLRPIVSTSSEGIDSIELTDWVDPELLPTLSTLLPIPLPTPFPTPTPTLPPLIALSEQPAGFELKPPGPENVPWVKVPGLQDTEEYRQLTFNPWHYLRKRSGTISPLPPFTAKISALLTYTPVQDQEGLMGAQQLGREYRVSYSQGFSLVIFIFLVMGLVGVAVMRATATIKRKLRHRLV